MLKIRLQMTGRRNDRHFRIIVTEHTQGPKSGKYVEKIGFINPRTKESKIDAERAKYWLSVGAQPTDRIYNMLVDEGVLEGPKKNVLPKKTPIAKDEPEGENSETTDDQANSEEADNEQDSEEVSEKGENSEETNDDEKSDT